MEPLKRASLVDASTASLLQAMPGCIHSMLPIGSRVNDSVLGLFLHVLDPFLAATLHFLGADIFLVGAQHPLVAKWIEHGAHAVAPELVLGGLYKLGPCLYGPVDRGVHVGHIDHESAGGSAPRFRAEGIPLLEFIREHETGIADLHFRVADLVAHGKAIGFLGVECL